jgi:hypothetical protein
MSSVPKRVESAPWMSGDIARSLTLDHPARWKVAQTGVMEAPKLLDGGFAAPRDISLPLVDVFRKCERQISVGAIVLLMLLLAAISGSATYAGIEARDAALALDGIKNRVGILEKELQNAKRTPLGVDAASVKVLLPVESEEVIWVPMPEQN